MSYVPKYFSWSEFDSPDEPGSGMHHMDERLLHVLDLMREECGPLVLNSAYRSPAHNEKVGGVDSSAHTSGKAADVRYVTSGQLYKILRAAIRNGVKRIGIGKSFVHVDVDELKPQEVVWRYQDTFRT